MKDKLSSIYVRYNYFDFLLYVPKLILTDMFPMTEKVIKFDVCALDIILCGIQFHQLVLLPFSVPYSKPIVKLKSLKH